MPPRYQLTTTCPLVVSETSRPNACISRAHDVPCGIAAAKRSTYVGSSAAATAANSDNDNTKLARIRA